MNAMAAKKKRVHVTLDDVCAGPYLVEEEHADGCLVIAPDTAWKAIRTRGGYGELTKRQWHEFLSEHGALMQPPDGS